MKPIKARITNALSHGSKLETCDNSGAKIVKIISFKKKKTTKGRSPSGGVGDLVLISVKKGNPEMRKKTSFAVIVRQRKEYRRRTGQRIKFEDNAIVVLKDQKGNPKGTLIKGAIAQEVADRWPEIAKQADIIV